MTNVMLGGSRHLSFIPAPALEKMNYFIEQEAWFLVGDAPGADSLFQKLLVSKKYLRVVVFTSLSEARNNFGGWETRFIETGLKSQSAAKHTVKDRKMIEIASEGLLIWDNESPGTLANAIDFVESGKSCSFWSPGDEFLWSLDSPRSLNSLLESNLKVAQESQKRLATYRKREQNKVKQSDAPGLFTN